MLKQNRKTSFFKRVAALFLFSWAAWAAAIQGPELELGNDGYYDGSVRINRGESGALLFQDQMVTTPVALIDLTGGVSIHHELGGLGGDDHLQYLNEERHGTEHGPAFNSALPILDDVAGHTVLNDHLTDPDIHLNGAENVEVSGQWRFTTPPQIWTGILFSEDGEPGEVTFDFPTSGSAVQGGFNAFPEPAFFLEAPLNMNDQPLLNVPRIYGNSTSGTLYISAESGNHYLVFFDGKEIQIHKDTLFFEDITVNPAKNNHDVIIHGDNNSDLFKVDGSQDAVSINGPCSTVGDYPFVTNFLTGKWGDELILGHEEGPQRIVIEDNYETIRLKDATVEIDRGLVIDAQEDLHGLVVNGNGLPRLLATDTTGNRVIIRGWLEAETLRHLNMVEMEALSNYYEHGQFQLFPQDTEKPARGHFVETDLIVDRACTFNASGEAHDFLVYSDAGTTQLLVDGSEKKVQVGGQGMHVELDTGGLFTVAPEGSSVNNLRVSETGVSVQNLATAGSTYIGLYPGDVFQIMDPLLPEEIFEVQVGPTRIEAKAPFTMHSGGAVYATETGESFAVYSDGAGPDFKVENGSVISNGPAYLWEGLSVKNSSAAFYRDVTCNIDGGDYDFAVHSQNVYDTLQVDADEDAVKIASGAKLQIGSTDHDFDLSDGLANQWKMNDGSGTTVEDSAGSYDGTAYGSPSWTAGQINGALDFDGTDDYVDCGDVLDYPGGTSTAEFSVSVWLKRDSSHIGYIASKYSSEALSLQSWGIRVHDSYVYALFYDGSGNLSNYRVTNPNSVGTWEHWVIHFDPDGSSGNQISFYTNSVPCSVSALSSAASSINNSPTHFRIGAREDYYSSLGSPFDGLIDDVRIYSRDLSANEIFLLYKDGSGTEDSDSVDFALDVTGKGYFSDSVFGLEFLATSDPRLKTLRETPDLSALTPNALAGAIAAYTFKEHETRRHLKTVPVPETRLLENQGTVQENSKTSQTFSSPPRTTETLYRFQKEMVEESMEAPEVLGFDASLLPEHCVREVQGKRFVSLMSVQALMAAQQAALEERLEALENQIEAMSAKEPGTARSY